jgi:adenylate cyclase
MPPERKALARRSLWGALIGLGAGVILLVLQAAGWLAPLENVTWDWRARALAKPGETTNKVKVVVLDQASLDWALKTNGLSWPWPRQVYAPIVQFLARGGAKAVALDIIFSEPSNLTGDDEALGQALHESGMAVGAVMLGRSTGHFKSWPPGWQAKLPALDGDQTAPTELISALSTPRAVLPVEHIAAGCKALGNVMEEADRDQVIRRITPVRWFSGRAVLTLGLAAYCPAGDCKLAWDSGGLGIGGHFLPLDLEGRAVLNFRGPPGTHEKFSAAAIIQSELMLQEGRKPTVEPGLFKDCYVIVGFTAPGLHELRATPLSSNYPGLEVHATALDNLLSDDFITPTPFWLAALALMLLTLVSGLVAVRLDKTWQITLCFIAALAAPVLLGLAAYGQGWWWPVAAPFLAVLLTMLGIVVLKYSTEGRDRRFIKQVFRHYLSPEVIERILDDPSRLRLGGERRELSIYFSDLQGFTSISERMSSEDLTELLNDYLSEMTDIILDQGGTLDKYEGDAIIAFWNAPLDQPDHATRAVRAALLCQKALRDRQEEFAARAGGPLKARIGLNTGTVVVGNLGSKSRFDYTVLGDAANLASRLEGANKIFDTGILVSQTTWEQTGGAFAGRELGSVRVVGRKGPVKVYEPLGLEGDDTGHDNAAFSEGMYLMRKGRWDEAATIFHNLKDDPAAQAFLRRCRELMTQRAEIWDGVWEQSEK